nr:hypothetical protein [Tanacetum cinerariifolium]
RTLAAVRSGGGLQCRTQPVSSYQARPVGGSLRSDTLNRIPFLDCAQLQKLSSIKAAKAFWHHQACGPGSSPR